MVTEYGMSDDIGPISFGPDGMRGGSMWFPGASPEISEALSERIDAEVARLAPQPPQQRRVVRAVDADDRPRRRLGGGGARRGRGQRQRGDQQADGPARPHLAP